MGRRARHKKPGKRPLTFDGGGESADWRLPLVFYVLAFASGAAALTYELAWAQMLALTFGSTTLAASGVIAGFMGGMGIGAALYHRLYDRIARPVWLYGWLEIGIAVTTALISAMLYSLPEVFAGVAQRIPDVWVVPVRFVGVFGLLLIPTALMGATFPALCTVLIHRVGEVDHRLGVIYGVNTVGGAIGALLAGLFIIERLGLSLSVTVANGLNVAVGLTALMLLRTPVLDAADRRALEGETAIPTSLPRFVTGPVLLLSGLTTLAYEILWFRAMRYLVGISTYALTTVLVVFLIGLGLGSFLMRPAVRRGHAERMLGYTQLGIGVLAVAAMACFWAIRSFTSLDEEISIFSFAVRSKPWWSRLMLDAGLATLIMLPATLLMGLSFPLASRLFLGDVRQLSARTGLAYLLANIGSVLGAILGAVLVLPMLGTIGGTKFLAAVNIVIGLVVLRWVTDTPRRLRLAGLTCAVAVVGLAVALPATLPLKGEPIGKEPAEVLYVEEGDLATVQVLEAKHKKDERRAMTIDGWCIGWGRGFEGGPTYRKQVLLVHLPMILDPRLESVLNIGLGAGATLETLTQYPQLNPIDCVEINAAVVRASAYFSEAESIEDSRVRLVVEDVVHFLLRTENTYDLVVSDGKQHPFFAGNAAMLCREFYQSVLRRMTDRALFIQWSVVGMLPLDFEMNLRTLSGVFPYVELFYYAPDSVFVIASRQPLKGRPTLDDLAYSETPAQAGLRPYYIESAAAVLSRWVAGKSQIAQVLPDGPISTWDRPILDFSAYKSTLADLTRAKCQNLQFMLRAEQASVEAARAGFVTPSGPFAKSAGLIRRSHEKRFCGQSMEALSLAGEAVYANPEDMMAKMVHGAFRREAAAAQRRRPRP